MSGSAGLAPPEPGLTGAELIARAAALRDQVRSEQDPIEQVRQRLLGNKWATEDELKKMDADVRSVVSEAAEFATVDPEPDPSELYTDVLR